MSYLASYKQHFGYAGFFFLTWLFIIEIWAPVRNIDTDLAVYTLVAEEGLSSTYAVYLTAITVFLSTLLILVAVTAIISLIALNERALMFTSAALLSYIVYVVVDALLIGDVVSAVGGAIGGTLPLWFFWYCYRGRIGSPAPEHSSHGRPAL